MAPSVEQDSALAPLRHPLFRGLWIASMASSMGVWIHEFGAVWLITSLDNSPLVVSLVPAAAAAAIFLFSLPAGALADRMDRPRLLLFAQVWMMAVTAVFAVLSSQDLARPWMLILFTFLLSAGSAVHGPVRYAILPELVPKNELPAAIALNSVALNATRALGPTLGGVVVALGGASTAFALNAVTYLGMIVVLLRWPARSAHEPFSGRVIGIAIRDGMRQAVKSPMLRTVLLRGTKLGFVGSAVFSLLPALARYELRLEAVGFGALVGSIGLGVCAGMLLLPYLRRRLAPDALVAAASLAFALAMGSLALVSHLLAISTSLLALGAAMIALVSSFLGSALNSMPARMRGRALSMYLFVGFGGQAVGGVFWGAVANVAGVRATLLGAAGAGILLTLASARAALPRLATAVLTPLASAPTRAPTPAAPDSTRYPAQQP